MKSLFFRVLMALLCGLLVSSSCSSIKKLTSNGEPNTLVFDEIWGYLLSGEEKAVKGDEPFTDIFYFAASINRNGRLKGKKSLPGIRWANDIKPRIHLVVFELDNPSLLKECLNDRDMRNKLVGDIVEFSREFDGVQIDFEAVRNSDGEAFVEFLTALKGDLGEKTLSVALPARRYYVKDGYDYAEIGKVADRVYIMAYDEHWRTSKPGPVASVKWCRSIVKYARKNIPQRKLVMGLPLYGRAWQVREINRAVRFQNVQDIMKNNWVVKPKYHQNMGPYLEYKEEVKVRVYYEDSRSLTKKLRLYRNYGVNKVGFWRIGQGPEDLWPRMTAGAEKHEEGRYQ